MYYYYKMEHKKSADTNYLVDTLTLEKNIATTKDGLYHKDEEYWYQGNVENNYLYYSGLTWRILGVDKNKNIKLVTDEVITTLSYHGMEYQQSDVFKWLNQVDTNHTGIFYQNLNGVENNLVPTNYCNDIVATSTKITCKKQKQANVSLLSLSDYDKAKGKNSFLNQGTTFYTLSMDEDGKVWVIQKDGTVTSMDVNNTGVGVRPVITLKNTTVLVSGNGTKNDPYQIDTMKKVILKDTNVGEYVSYSGNLFRVIGKENGNVKVMSETVLPTKESFSDYGISYDSDLYGTLAYHLNQAYTLYYRNPEWIVSGTFYTGSYRGSEETSYQSIYESSIKTMIGLPQVADYFVGNVTGIYTINPASSLDEMMMTIENGKYYADFATQEKGIRPVFYLNGSLKIIGDGTKENPYQLGV